MKIVICGSMALVKEMIVQEELLVAAGHEVVLPDFTREYAQMDSLEEIHKESAKNKIEHDLIRGYYKSIQESDAILVVNGERKGIAGYVGGNTFLEMGFAFVLEKPIYLLHEIPKMGHEDEIVAMMPVLLSGDVSKIQ
jgi:nucleoside 2-deoxyribosyltransferase